VVEVVIEEVIILIEERINCIIHCIYEYCNLINAEHNSFSNPNDPPVIDWQEQTKSAHNEEIDLILSFVTVYEFGRYST
jgi:hypothetical protein